MASSGTPAFSQPQNVPSPALRPQFGRAGSGDSDYSFTHEDLEQAFAAKALSTLSSLTRNNFKLGLRTHFDFSPAPPPPSPIETREPASASMIKG